MYSKGGGKVTKQQMALVDVMLLLVKCLRLLKHIYKSNVLKQLNSYPIIMFKVLMQQRHYCI